MFNDTWMESSARMIELGLDMGFIPVDVKKKTRREFLIKNGVSPDIDNDWQHELEHHPMEFLKTEDPIKKQWSDIALNQNLKFKEKIMQHNQYAQQQTQAQTNPYAQQQANPFAQQQQNAYAQQVMQQKMAQQMRQANPYAQMGQSQQFPPPQQPQRMFPPQQQNPFGQTNGFPPAPQQQNPFGQSNGFPPAPQQPNPFAQQQQNPFGQQQQQQQNPFAQQQPAQQRPNPFAQQPAQQGSQFAQAGMGQARPNIVPPGYSVDGRPFSSMTSEELSEQPLHGNGGLYQSRGLGQPNHFFYDAHVQTEAKKLTEQEKKDAMMKMMGFSSSTNGTKPQNQSSFDSNINQNQSSFGQQPTQQPQSNHGCTLEEKGKQNPVMERASFGTQATGGGFDPRNSGESHIPLSYAENQKLQEERDRKYWEQQRNPEHRESDHDEIAMDEYNSDDYPDYQKAVEEAVQKASSPEDGMLELFHKIESLEKYIEGMTINVENLLKVQEATVNQTQKLTNVISELDATIAEQNEEIFSLKKQINSEGNMLKKHITAECVKNTSTTAPVIEESEVKESTEPVNVMVDNEDKNPAETNTRPAVVGKGEILGKRGRETLVTKVQPIFATYSEETTPVKICESYDSMIGEEGIVTELLSKWMLTKEQLDAINHNETTLRAMFLKGCKNGRIKANVTDIHKYQEESANLK